MSFCLKKKPVILLLCLLNTLSLIADDYETMKTEKIQNPMLWADVPDPDIIRVGDTFYLVSTTMHLMPGAPIMKSKDLNDHDAPDAGSTNHEVERP